MKRVIQDIILSAALTGLTASAVSYVMMKLAYRSIRKDAVLSINEWLNSEKGQKTIFTLGAIAGNGVKSGIGFTTKSGKFKMEDLIGMAIGKFFGGNQNIFPTGQQTEQSGRVGNEEFG